MMDSHEHNESDGKRAELKRPALWGAFALASFSAAYFGIPMLNQTTYLAATPTDSQPPAEERRQEGPQATHLPTPEPVRAIYMTQCVAGTPSFRSKLIVLAEESSINSIVVDIKDFTGTVVFESDHPLLSESRGDGCRVGDFRELVEEMHEKGIYVIGRITAFQDPLYTARYPELAVRRASATSTPWQDYKGLSFIDVGAQPFWDYLVAIGEEAYALGVDELNYDYIRYPSDGNMKDVYYAHSDGSDKAEELERFFSYLHEELKPTGAMLSADLFGMTTTNTDHLNIGQQLERALPYFDYIAPMVYPSHYPKGFRGYQNVNEHPYDIVHFSMARAVERLLATTTPVAMLGATRIGTSTPALYEKPVYDPKKLRPWLQDFDYPVPYTPEMVTAQFEATYDAGLDSWMLWDPANTYTRSVLGSATATSTAR